MEAGIKDSFSKYAFRGDLDGCFQELVAESSQLGRPYVVWGKATAAKPEDTANAKTSFPISWVAYYMMNNGMSVDPVVRALVHTYDPFVWHKLGPLKSEQVELMRKAAEHGLVDGLTVPLCGPDNSKYAVSFAGSEIFDEDISPFVSLAGAFHVWALTMVSKHQPLDVGELSSDEVNLLRCLDGDMNQAEIADYFSTSQANVSQRLSRLRKKFNVKTNTGLLSNAIRYAWIGSVDGNIERVKCTQES